MSTSRQRTPSIRHRTTVVGIVSLGALMAASCGGGDPVEDVQEAVREAVADVTSTTTGGTSPSSTATTTPEETFAEPAHRMPLTGEPLESADEIPDRPALAIKMPNNPQAMPQTGLNEADIVFEEIINDRITRFAAVFHSEGSDPVGPIRSGRAQDVDLLSSLNSPLFAWSGGNAGVTRVVNASSLVSLNYVGGFGNSYYRRDGRGGSPHNLFSDTETLWSHTPEDFTVPTPIFPYLRPGEVAEGDGASIIEVTMDSIDVRWEYDEASGRYLRWQDGEEHMSELTGQVWADNVVVMFMDYVSGIIDARSPEAQSVGSGPLLVFSAGTVRAGTWSRPDNLAPFTFATAETGGELIRLEPGRTWVELPRNDPANVQYVS
ncbi:MAG: DUF3048 domain-containing protein [Ilumatobacteraceae bacterium]